MIEFLGRFVPRDFAGGAMYLLGCGYVSSAIINTVDMIKNDYVGATEFGIASGIFSLMFPALVYMRNSSKERRRSNNGDYHGD